MDGRGAVAGPALSGSVFVLYRDSALRREALSAAAGSPVRYCLFGLDELGAAGLTVSHNLVPDGTPPWWARAVGSTANGVIRRAGGTGGDFASVIASRRRIGAAEAVFATVDTLGLPLALLRRARLVPRTPVVYASIGLLERVAQIRSRRVRNAYRAAVGSVDAIVAYGSAEADELRRWLSPLPAPPPVRFLPFGVDTHAVRPPDAPPDLDVVSVGGDPQRDYGLLVRVAARTPDRRYTVAAAPEQAVGELASAPSNMTVRTTLPFSAALDLLGSARVVALPVRENAYSGATTVLLQALALGKPVVVSATRAIADGYGLVDGETCRLVPPGDAAGFERALVELGENAEAAVALGRRGRAHVERSLRWSAYVSGLVEMFGAVAPTTQASA